MTKRSTKYQRLADKYIEKHDTNPHWSSFDRMESMAIRLFAEWLDRKVKRNDEESKGSSNPL